MPEFQGTTCSTQARYMKFKWQQRDSNRQHLVLKRKLNHLAKLYSLAKWLSVSLRTKWLWVRIPLLLLNIYHQDVTAIKLEAQLEILKTYFDEKEDSTIADTIEKIRKLPQYSKVYFS